MKTQPPPASGFNRIIDSQQIDRLGLPKVFDRAAGDLRNELVTMHAHHAGRPVRFHIVAYVEQLTDSAGAPLSVRGKGE